MWEGRLEILFIRGGDLIDFREKHVWIGHLIALEIECMSFNDNMIYT